MHKKPNFLIGGAGNSGTSQLSAMLVQHPDIYLPAQMRPEPHYFYKSWEYAKPLTYYLERYFGNVADEKAVGERSSSYLYMPEVASRVQSAFPEMRWVFCLRNPIERTFANYRFTLLGGFEDLEFEEALEQEAERTDNEAGVFKEIQPHAYTGRSFYGRQLQHLLSCFPPRAVLCLKSEEQRADPVGTVRKACAFLEVDTGFAPQAASAFASPHVRSPRVQKQCRDHFKERFDTIIEYIRIHGDIPILDSQEDIEAANTLRHNLSGEKPVMNMETRQHLRALFAEDMALLRTLVNFDIEDWT